MAQTTGGMAGAAAQVEISTDGAAWTDISGFANHVEPGGGDREIGEVFTFDGDTPIITKAKRKMLTLKTNIVYTEGAAEASEKARAAYEAGTPLYVRWTPAGNLAGKFQFISSAGIVKTPVYPKVKADDAQAILFDAEIVCASITKAVHA